MVLREKCRDASEKYRHKGRKVYYVISLFLTGDLDRKDSKPGKLALEQRNKFYEWVGLGQLSVLGFSDKINAIISVNVGDCDRNFVGMVLWEL